MFNREDILLTSAKNESKKEHLEMVMMTGLAQQIGKVKGWAWIQQHFPIVYLTKGDDGTIFDEVR